ncbi:MAG: biotin--[acetyl-CoA-carboxylase] ligase [Thiobacillus sp.]|nr:biotin--[acetyl-CoA-carboxylase] ligase [Thiobacillus sp.]
MASQKQDKSQQPSASDRGKILAVISRIHQALLPILRRLSDGAFHSGQDMAREFGLSRASVFNVIKQAEALGVTIHAVRSKGYKLPDVVEWMDAAMVAQFLGRVAHAYEIRIEDSVASTNSALMAAALTGVPDGSVLCVEHQYAGKGRRGREWHAALGGSLTFSVLLRFERGLQSIAGLSLVAGLAVARAVNRHSRYPAQLKWPNDVMVGHRKLAGILVEVQGDMHGAAFAVVGIGLNVRLNDAQRDSIDQAVIDLAEMGVTVGRNQFLADCLQELHTALVIFREHGFSALRSEWMALDAYSGKDISLFLPSRQGVHGIASGVDDTGAVLLRDSNNMLTAYSGGEISLRLRQQR